MAAGKRVLIVDDDESIREFVEMALEDEGYDVVSAEHGAAALDVLNEGLPNLILLDMAMPVMDGWEFARQYRARPGPHAPIVVVTAAREAAERARQISADNYLAKPFDLDRLIQLVEQYAV